MCFFKVSSLLTLSLAFAAAHIIELPNGKIQGVIRENYYSYTNIRYAEPPVRFEPSVPYGHSWTDIWNATGEIVRCIPFEKRANATEGQEDCLVLNVFVPKTATDAKPLPVFAFIPGGAFMFAGSAFYSPEAIMAQQNMIVVLINYRLGPFGFLTTGDQTIQGNLGLKDQLLALRWIKHNIHLFSGDPEKILLIGQSAGGASVHLQMLRKEAKDLVSAAASLSGTALNPWVMQKNAKEKTETLAKLLGCPLSGEELKECLKERSIEEIYTAVLKMQTYLDNPFNVFGPIIESADIPGAFITEEPRNIIEKGRIIDIPWMATFTTEDGAYNCASLLEKNDAGVEHIEELNDRWFELAPYLLFYYDEPSEQIKHKLSSSLKEKYMSDKRFSRETYPLLQKMFSDVLYINGIRETIQMHRMFGHNSVYGYIYGNPHNNGVGNFLANDLDFRFGATHGDDEQLFLPLTFGTNYTRGINDEEIAKHLIRMFESFVLKGTPRFGQTSLPANGNTDQIMQYLQIFEQSYCIGPWESYSNRQCNRCTCYDYKQKEQENDK